MTPSRNVFEREFGVAGACTMVYLRTLGESVIEVGKARIGPSAPHMFAAMLYLVLERGRRVPRARLQELLFPIANDRRASHSLRQLLYRLRQLCVELECDANGVLLPASSVEADYDRLIARGEHSRSQAGRMLGGLLPGFAPTFSRPFAEWFEQRRGDLLAQIRRALTAEMSAYRRAARWSDAEQTARAILAVDPFNEEATLALAEAMALGGAKVDAVQLLDAYLQEVGSQDRALRVPAAILRRRIAERLPDIPQAGSSRFIGRHAPLGTLRDLLEHARAGNGCACHLWGEAGIGKTRLVSEFSRAAVLEGTRAEYLGLQPHDIRRPMAAFTDLVPSLLRLPGALGCSPEAIAFLTKLFKYEADATSLSSDVLEAELLSANITRAISELLDAVTAESALVVIAEDAQWLDAISLRVFADLIAERKRRSLMLVLTSRDREVGIDRRHVDRLTTLRLDPLLAEESEALLADLLNRGGVPPAGDLMQRCLGMAAGNPFFLHSLVVHYMATRSLDRIPEPLNALLTHRFNLLNANARRVFEASAILGRNSTLDNLEAVLSLPKYELLDGLQILEELGFITSHGARVVATHVLLSDLAVKRVSPTVRKLLHRSVARVLQDAGPRDGSAAVLWDCADHWLQADLPERSIAVLRACGRYALEIGRPADAVGALQRAAELAVGSQDQLPTLRELVTAAEIAGAWSTILHALRAIRRHVVANAQSPDLGAKYELLELEARVYVSTDPRAVVAQLREYVRRDDIGIGHRLRGCIMLASVAEDLLSPELASEAYRNAPVVSRTDAEIVQRHQFDLIYHASFGDLDQAAEAARRILVSLEFEENLAAQCRMRLLAGGALVRAGFLQEGNEVLQVCYELATAGRLLTAQHRSASHLACALRDAGAIVDALAWHEKAREAFDHLGGQDRVAGFFSNCVLFAIQSDDLVTAREWVSRAFSEVPPARVGHAGLHFRALDLRIKQLAHSFDCPDAELTDLLDSHMRFRGFGHHDEVMEAIWYALARKERSAYADELLREYLTRYRRLRWPLTANLQMLASRLNRDRSTIGGDRAPADSALREAFA